MARSLKIGIRESVEYLEKSLHHAYSALFLDALSQALKDDMALS